MYPVLPYVSKDNSQLTVSWEQEPWCFDVSLIAAAAMQTLAMAYFTRLFCKEVVRSLHVAPSQDPLPRRRLSISNRKVNLEVLPMP